MWNAIWPTMKYSMDTPHDGSNRLTDAEMKGNFDANLARLTAQRCRAMGVTAGQLRLLAKRWRKQHAAGTPSDVGAAEVDALVLPHTQDAGSLCPRPYVIRGLWPAHLLRRVHAETIDLFNGYSPCIYVLEPMLDHLIAAMHAHDLTAVLDDDRVVILVGSDLVRRLETILDDETESVSLPKYNMALPSGLSVSGETLDAMISDLDQKRTQRTVQLHQQAESVYAGRDRAWWVHRFAQALNGDNGRPLRVLIPVSRYSTYVRHSAGQLSRALERLGCETQILTEPNSHCVLPASAYARAFVQWQPDLVCQIDHLRHESRGLIPLNVPHWCWVQDRLSHLFNPIAASKVNELEMVLGLGADLLVRQHGYPANQCVPVLNGTDTQVYSPEPLPEEALRPHRCDIAYVCNHSEPAEELPNSLINTIANDEQERAFLVWVHDLLAGIINDTAHEPTSRIGRRRLLKIMQSESKGRFTDDGLNQVYDFFCLPLFDRMYRHQALRWVIDYCEKNGRVLKLYGKGWENHQLTQPYACGEVENGRALRAVYQAAQVNLHVSSFGSLHQRVFDGFASGGMVLCRRTVADASYALFQQALRASNELGRRHFRMHETKQFRHQWEQVHGAGSSDRNPNRPFDLERGPWHHFLRPADPCHFRSYSQLAGSIEQITFRDEQTLGQQLDRLLDHAETRGRLVEPMRKRIVSALSIDVIAQYALTRYQRILHPEAGDDEHDSSSVSVETGTRLMMQE
ncbi:MAG: hypothetical protein D8M59_13180 [Planctomycetes bacterium]|nr:hypothetical protein [Planctomycetota bacterium]